MKSISLKRNPHARNPCNFMLHPAFGRHNQLFPNKQRAASTLGISRWELTFVIQGYKTG
jgi:hypothetical protein